MTEIEVMTVPRIDEFLTSVNESRYFTVLDNLKKFSQIQIDEKDMYKASFIGP